MPESEGEWFVNHPGARILEAGDQLTLWNFPVAKADLADAHVEAIEKFAQEGFIANSTEHQPMDFRVRGHASISGAESTNLDLALRRAENVKAVLTRMGFRSVVVESVGSSQPADTGTSGEALARNRRVEMTRSMRSYPEVIEEPPKPAPREPKDPTKFAPSVRVRIDLPLRTLQTPRVIIAASIVGELTVTLKGASADPVDAGVTTGSGEASELTEEFAQLLARDVIGPKVGLDAGTSGAPPSIDVGIPAEHWFLLPKVGYQDGPYPIHFNFKAIVARLPIVDYRSAQVHMEFSGNFRFEIGPSASAVRTYPSTTDPGPTVTGAPAGFMEAGPLMIAATIAAAGKAASPLAQVEIKKVVLNLAARDGAASRAAWLAGAAEGEVAFIARRAEWRDKVFEDKEEGEKVQRAWSERGSDQVDAVLQALETKAAQDERKAAWKTKYGGGQKDPPFDFVREQIFRDLNGYDDDQGDLKRLIEGL